MRRFLSSFVFCWVIAAAGTAQAVTIASQTETTPYPGVRVVALRTTSPTTRAWVTYVDLCNDYVHVDATKAPSSLRTTGAWASSVGAQVAVNGDFYKTGPVRVYGQAVGSGVAWPTNQTGAASSYSSEWYYQNYGWIAFGPDWVDFTHTGYVKKNASKFGIKEGFRPNEITHALPAGTLALVSGFPALVVEGKRVTCSSPTDSSCFTDRTDMRSRHPRTAMGITQDRRTLLLLTVDGRTSVSAGMYGTELAELMDKLGAWQAFNLDGGGSTQMWVQGSNYVNSATGNNGGSLRSVANHWGVFAGKSSGKTRKPGHCVDYMLGAVLQSSMQQQGTTTDYDGDGRADACIRGENGLLCSAGGESSLGKEELFVDLKDASGWANPANYATLRMGDIDGDGKADLCGRGNDGIFCWTTTSTPMDTRVDGPPLSNDGGWNRPPYYSTIRLADVDGDGLDDLCARGSKGFRCYLSLGDRFGEVIQTSLFSDEDGFGDADKYGTIRMGDIDGDGQADVCARSAEGMLCYLSDGNGFPKKVEAPTWTDENGWWRPMYFSTIQLVDVDGDGRADLCARTSTKFQCFLSEGTSFGPAIEKEILKNDDGWSDPSLYATIRLADIDGDGDADLCARDKSKVYCWPWEGTGFGERWDGPDLSNDEGWNLDRKYGSLRLADVTGDGKADLCGLDDDGLFCFPSEGASFGKKLTGPSWAGQGWMHPSVYGTLMVAGVVVPEKEQPDAGHFEDAGDASPGPKTDDGGVESTGEGGVEGQKDAGSDQPFEMDDASSDAGCGCRMGKGASPSFAFFAALLGLAVGMRRRSATRYS